MGVCITVGGLNLPPVWEVSCMSVMEILTLLVLVTNIISIANNNKKK